MNFTKDIPTTPGAYWYVGILTPKDGFALPVTRIGPFITQFDEAMEDADGERPEAYGGELWWCGPMAHPPLPDEVADLEPF